MLTTTELVRGLKHYFGYEKFKPGQIETLTALARQQSTVAILPTGTGKSLCYQLYGLLTKQLVLVVSPLISLMQDQVKELKFVGEHQATALTSMLSGRDKSFVLRHLNEYHFIFISPEMALQPAIIQRFKALKLGLLVIDEAHCISQWGPDFRPDYLQLGKLRQILGQPLTLALTATATPQIKKDICQLLFAAAQPQLVQQSIDRPNIFLAVESTANFSEKNAILLRLVQQLKTPGLIYFTSRKATEKFARLLTEKTGLSAAAYHADLNQQERFAVQQQFMLGNLDVVCATSAFGMGINQKNVRYVIHYHLPTDLESYLQEIGRAGRDGQQSIAILLYSTEDFERQRQLSFASLPAVAELKNYQAATQQQRQILTKNELTYQLIDFYAHQGLNVKQQQEMFAQRRQQKASQLRTLQTYLTLTTCRRKFLCQYFGEKTEHLKHSANCCQPAGQTFDLRDLNLQCEHVERKASVVLPSYQQLLKKLFADQSNQL
ncbi:MAG: RecQ family ATP-dependent DNA helicase [Liquorilactobacillus ghanensis]|uniref:RecQ family ATP-dependent DNA helicase n=1 Tax=Liquorilactobacillus ghanensis TaxID=399370 RepID=UPI0039E961DF